MNREDYKAACMAEKLPNPYALPSHDLARLALENFYDQGRYQDRPDLAVQIVDMQYCAYANECFSFFYDLRSRLPYGIDSQAEITEISHTIAKDCFGRKEAFAAVAAHIDRMAEEFEVYKEFQAQTTAFIDRTKTAYGAWQEELALAAQTDPAYYERLLTEGPATPDGQIDWSDEAANYMY